jgi:hypothetical protein
MQQREAQLRARQAARSSTIASALVMIERNPRERAYDRCTSSSRRDTKYLVFQKWKRHSDFINNVNKTREDKALARMALVIAAYNKG